MSESGAYGINKYQGKKIQLIDRKRAADENR